MALGRKTPEQEAANAAAKAAADQENAATAKAKEVERARAEFLKTPVGQATKAWDDGHGFFEVQLEVGSSQRDSTIWGGNNSAYSKVKSRSHAGTLSTIEQVGWHLEHVGHVFVVTSESSRDKFLATGQQTAVSGVTMGIYLFRRAEG